MATGVSWTFFFPRVRALAEELATFLLSVGQLAKHDVLRSRRWTLHLTTTIRTGLILLMGTSIMCVSAKLILDMFLMRYGTIGFGFWSARWTRVSHKFAKFLFQRWRMRTGKQILHRFVKHNMSNEPYRSLLLRCECNFNRGAVTMDLDEHHL